MVSAVNIHIIFVIRVGTDIHIYQNTDTTLNADIPNLPTFFFYYCP